LQLELRRGGASYREPDPVEALDVEALMSVEDSEPCPSTAEDLDVSSFFDSFSDHSSDIKRVNQKSTAIATPVMNFRYDCGIVDDKCV